MRHALSIVIGVCFFCFGLYAMHNISLAPPDTVAGPVSWFAFGMVSIGGLILIDDVVLPIWDRLNRPCGHGDV